MLALAIRNKRVLANVCTTLLTHAPRSARQEFAGDDASFADRLLTLSPAPLGSDDGRTSGLGTADRTGGA